MLDHSTLCLLGKQRPVHGDAWKHLLQFVSSCLVLCCRMSALASLHRVSMHSRTRCVAYSYSWVHLDRHVWIQGYTYKSDKCPNHRRRRPNYFRDTYRHARYKTSMYDVQLATIMSPERTLDSVFLLPLVFLRRTNSNGWIPRFSTTNIAHYYPRLREIVSVLM